MSKDTPKAKESSNSANVLDKDIMTSDDHLALDKAGVTLPMGYSQLKHYLPHRYPFMLLDRVISCRPGLSITGYKNVTFNEPFFQGHFPDVPIMPGVLIVEAMAQLSGVLGFISKGKTSEDGYLYLFAGVDKVRFKKQVVPGDQLILTSELTMEKQDIYKFNCRAYVGEKLAASAQVMIARQAMPSSKSAI